MDKPFFKKSGINSPCTYPARYWELDDQGNPTTKMIDSRRTEKFITPVQSLGNEYDSKRIN